MKTFHVAPDKTLVEINQSEKVSIQCLKNHHIKDAIKNERSIIGTYMLPEEVDKYFDRTKPKKQNNEGGNSKNAKKIEPDTGTIDGTGEVNSRAGEDS